MRRGGRTPRLKWTALAAILAIQASVTGAQGGQLLPPPNDEEIRRHGIFIDSFDVSLINVEVHVTRDGIPLTDLTVDDFEVLDDGQPVAITHFFRVEAGDRIAVPESSPGGEEQPPATPEKGLAEPSSVVVLVDHPFISPMSRQLVFDRLSEELDRLMSHGTRVMEVSKTRRVEVAQSPTSSRAEVWASLERLGGMATGNYASEVRTTIQAIERRTVATSSRQTGPGQSTAPLTGTAKSDAQGAYRDAQSHSQQVHAQVSESLGLLRAFLGSLAGLPGRKAVLYVADRLPLRSGELVWRVWYEKFGADWGSQLGATSVDTVLRNFDSHGIKRPSAAGHGPVERRPAGRDQEARQ